MRALGGLASSVPVSDNGKSCFVERRYIFQSRTVAGLVLSKARISRKTVTGDGQTVRTPLIDRWIDQALVVHTVASIIRIDRTCRQQFVLFYHNNFTSSRSASASIDTCSDAVFSSSASAQNGSKFSVFSAIRFNRK